MSSKFAFLAWGREDGSKEGSGNILFCRSVSLVAPSPLTSYLISLILSNLARIAMGRLGSSPFYAN